MAEFPFWDDVCLRGSIDRTPLPAPSRSLFDNDLFCADTSLDNSSLEPFPDLLPTLSISPSGSALRAAEHALSLNIERSDDDQASTFVSSCPLRMGAHTLVAPPAPVPPLADVLSTPALPEVLSCQNTPRSPGSRPWGSFLDENCPLRRRVKVTIVPSARKRGRETPIQPPPVASELSPSLKKPRHSQMRITAPRRAQTTFRVPRPGDPAARMTLDVRSPPVKRVLNISPNAGYGSKRVRSPVPYGREEDDMLNDFGVHSSVPADHSNNQDNDYKVSDDDLDRDILLEPDLEADGEPLPMDDQSQDFILSLESGPSDSMADPPAFYAPEPVLLPEPDIEPELAVYGVPARKRRPQKLASSPTGSGIRRDGPSGCARSFITASLQHRLSSMVRTRPSSKSLICQPSRAYSALPLVDAAVQAVARAARDYSDILSCHFPVAASAAATIAMCHPQSSAMPKKRRPARRRRVLLSFDDANVEPLVTEDDSITTESALTGFLNCPSPCKKKVST